MRNTYVTHGRGLQRASCDGLVLGTLVDMRAERSGAQAYGSLLRRTCYQVVECGFSADEAECSLLLLQAILAQLVLIGTLFLVTLLQPYARPIDNWLSIASLAGELRCGTLLPRAASADRHAGRMASLPRDLREDGANQAPVHAQQDDTATGKNRPRASLCLQCCGCC